MSNKVERIIVPTLVIALLTLGVLFFGLAYLSRKEISLALQIYAVAMGMLALAIGLLGWRTAQQSEKVAQESNERMQAMANLEFDEKIAVIEAHIQSIQRGEETSSKRILYDIKGCLRLKKWADEAEKKLLLQEVCKLREIAQSHARYDDLLPQLEVLEQEIRDSC